MEIIEIKTDPSLFDPEQLSDIDFSNSVVLCTVENNKNISYDNEYLYILNHNDISLHTQRILNNDIYVNFNPHIKWSVPLGVYLRFREVNKKIPIVDKVFVNYNDVENLNYHKLIELNFTLILNKERCNKDNLNKLKASKRMLTVGFEYGIFRNSPVENIYIIQNNYAYQEFSLHFDREDLDK